MSSKLRAWHRYWRRDLDDISNMAKPVTDEMVEAACKVAHAPEWYEMDATFGWSGGGMADLYTRKINREKLSLNAAERVRRAK